eukprot:scaffold82047_cov31-Tisochrysis_lutea.AAC.3
MRRPRSPLASANCASHVSSCATMCFDSLARCRESALTSRALWRCVEPARPPTRGAADCGRLAEERIGRSGRSFFRRATRWNRRVHASRSQLLFTCMLRASG